jgi:fused signal recognition particle receptor
MALDWFRKKKDRSTPPPPEGRDEAAPVDDGVAEPPPSEPENEAAGLPPADPPPETGGVLGRLKAGLAKTRQILTTDIDELFLGKHLVDDDMLEDLEELLITADMGVETTMDLMARLQKKRDAIGGAAALRKALKEEVAALLGPAVEPAPAAETEATAPRVVMVVGVNGVGKTTTIGKLAHQAAASGQKVIIVAADTFRAAAIEQLAIWARRAGVDIVKQKDNADPAAVAFDGVAAAVARKADLVLIDTAGRLHTKKNLMEELKKIKRVVSKPMPDAPHEILLVVDATTGQNAVAQARMFHEEMGVTGIALTKLDGTAKGGVAVSICHSLQIPLQYVGVGEGIADLQRFDAVRYADAMF